MSFVLLPRLLLWVALTVCAPARAGSPVELPPDMARILGRGELRVAMHRDDVPPFFQRLPDGQLDGLDVALARDIAATLGVDARFVRDATTYDALVDAVDRGEADVVISLLSRTLERARRVRFTTPYAELRQALLVNRLRTAPLRLERDAVAGLNQPGVRVGTIAGSAYVGFGREAFPAAELVAHGTWDEAVEDLLAGGTHALLYDEIEVRAWQQANPEQSLFVRASVLDARKDFIAMAVAWRDSHWLAWLDLYLESIRDNGLLDRLTRQYLKEAPWRAGR